jgi:hypothetical protein
MTKTETNWVDEEMKSLRLGDERLEKRVCKIISDFSITFGCTLKTT